uniref:Glycosyltransferase 2-like domain-containing protein n=1 Tax=viral metagenome TaxID=1070528 RepID=A0A6C0E8N6_9ZZZZ
MPKICLNMIVKNESRVIRRLMESVYKIIDSYCICDTGSTDDTVNIITEFFNEKNIPGKVVFEPFKDFGYNRTYAMKQCIELPDADYLLLLDADMILEFGKNLDIETFKNSLELEAYHIFQGSPSFFYKNVRILKNHPDYSYWGVTHEYVQTPPHARYHDIDRTLLFINDVGDGGAKAEKFERDIRLLEKGLEELPGNDRYTFYLANSYRDYGNKEKAIENYKKRIKIGGWQEEVWFSYYSIGKCYKDMGDMANAIFYWIEAYQYFPERIENLYEIVNYYRLLGKNRLAYDFYEIADYIRKNHTSSDHLFLQKDIYDYKLDYEFSIIGYYCNRHNHNIYKSCMKVLENPTVDEPTLKNVLSNYKFYTEEIHKFAIVKGENIRLLENIGESLNIDKNEFFSSTPSICFNNQNSQTPQKPTELIVNVRYVNYKIGDSGEYINKENITTINVIAVLDTTKDKWVKKTEFVLKYNESYDGLYVGLEDIRLFINNGELLFNANRGLEYHNMVIEHGKINLGSQSTESNLIKKIDQRTIEKNWTLFMNQQNEINMVYEWYPLTIGNIKQNDINLVDDKNNSLMELNITHKLRTPQFFKWVRGSTNGINIGNEIWFMCHMVSYEDRRYYYHIFVVLDLETYELKKYSRIFTFEKEKVEYTLGFEYMEDTKRFLIGYSIMDRETKYVMIPKHKIDELFNN